MNATTDLSLEIDLDIFSPRVPPAPTLRGLMNGLPISPLELPSPAAERPSMMALFTRQSFPAPVILRNPASSPVVSTSTSRTMPSFAGVAEEFASASSSSPKPRSVSTRSPGKLMSPYTGRRMSAIIRPPILPTPTPPSLLTSPRALGTTTIITPSPERNKTSLGRSSVYPCLHQVDTGSKRRPGRARIALSPSGCSDLADWGDCRTWTDRQEG